MQKTDNLVKPMLAAGGPKAAPAEAWAGLALLGVLIASGSLQAAAQAPVGGLEGMPWAAFGAALGLLLLAWRRGWAGHWAQPAGLTRAALAAYLGLMLLLALTQRLARVEGDWAFWIEDDALVSMQHARNLVEGRGLVWTLGQRVEGFSNPLWTLLMAGACAVLPRDLAPGLLLALNAALGAVGILAVARLARALGASALGGALAAAGYGLSYEHLWAGLSGMEAVAVAALCAVALADVAQALAGQRRIGARPFLLAGALGLLRFDGLLPAAAIVLLAGPALSARQRAAAWAWAVAPALAWAAFRLHYYGDLLPTPVRLKQGAWPGRWERGVFYVLRTGYHALAAWALGALAWAQAPLRRWALALALLLGYGVLTGGDIYPGTRYLAAAWPLLWALPAAALARALKPGRAAAVMAVAMLLSHHAFWAFPLLLNGGWAEARDRILVAKELDRKVAPGERVAAAWAGSFYYYSSVQGVDLLGKCDPTVARSAPEGKVPGHNKLDLEHSLARLRPEWVLSIPPGLPGQDAWMHAPYDAKTHRHPWFRDHCRPASASLAGPWVLYRCSPPPARP